MHEVASAGVIWSPAFIRPPVRPAPHGHVGSLHASQTVDGLRIRFDAGSALGPRPSALDRQPFPPPVDAPVVEPTGLPSRSNETAPRAPLGSPPAASANAHPRLGRSPGATPKRLRWLGLWGILMAIVVAAWSVSRDSGTDQSTTATLTHRVQRDDLQVTVLEKGTLESSNNVEIRSKVWGWKTVNWVIQSGAIVEEGDLLVELDASEMEKKVDDARINYHNSVADMITAESTVAVAEKSIDEYEQATFVETQGGIQQEIFDAEEAVSKAQLAYRSTTRLAAKGLVTPLQLRGDKFKLDSALQKLALKQTRLKALQEFKREKELERL